jgi:pantetheine-phosphate adenylyltransferase
LAKVAFYPGTFDPVTNGHVEILRGALALADRLVIAIGVNPAKQPMFSLDERKAMLASVVKDIGAAPDAVSVVTFEGLAVEAARRAGATILIRGLRDAGDFDYEMQMAGMNGALAPDVRTVWLPASPASRHITATLVRQVAALGGDVTAFVPPAAAAMIARRLR